MKKVLKNIWNAIVKNYMESANMMYGHWYENGNNRYVRR